jgi:septum formation protein
VLVLASASPRRRELLDRMGLLYEIEPADIDETLGPGEDPARYVERLALSKANEVFFRRHATQGARPDLFDPGLAVLGADTIVVSPLGAVLGKPADDASAEAMLRSLSGRTHRVLTGVAVVSRPADAAPDGTGPVVRNAVVVESTAVTFVDLTDREIAEYVATGEPADKAGAYGIQGRAGNFVARIDGSYDNVVGLPTHRVAELLGLR